MKIINRLRQLTGWKALVRGLSLTIILLFTLQLGGCEQLIQALQEAKQEESTAGTGSTTLNSDESNVSTGTIVQDQGNGDGSNKDDDPSTEQGTSDGKSSTGNTDSGSTSDTSNNSNTDPDTTNTDNTNPDNTNQDTTNNEDNTNTEEPPPPSQGVPVIVLDPLAGAECQPMVSSSADIFALEMDKLVNIASCADLVPGQLYTVQVADVATEGRLPIVTRVEVLSIDGALPLWCENLSKAIATNGIRCSFIAGSSSAMVRIYDEALSNFETDPYLPLRTSVLADGYQIETDREINFFLNSNNAESFYSEGFTDGQVAANGSTPFSTYVVKIYNELAAPIALREQFHTRVVLYPENPALLSQIVLEAPTSIGDKVKTCEPVLVTRTDGRQAIVCEGAFVNYAELKISVFARGTTQTLDETPYAMTIINGGAKYELQVELSSN